MNTILFLEPIFHEKIWGGNKLAKDFGYNVSGENIGECWAIAAHPNGDSKVINDDFTGYTLSRLWNEHREVFGDLPGDMFPLLIKIIDAKTDLSIQVHPDDKYARENENTLFGKTECWYILECDENSSLIIGHNARTKKEAENMVSEGKWKDFLREVKVKKGDFFQIDPGCIHAIKGGIVILETQQNSDITYRLYDYDRLSDDGKPRKLHIKQALDVINAPFVANNGKREINNYEGYMREHLISCKYYDVERIVVNSCAKIEQKYHFMNVSVIEGRGTVDGIDIKKGTHFILPYNYGIAEFTGSIELIVSYI